MPEISVDVDTSVDVDIDIVDVLEECSNSEIIDALDYLEENNFIRGKQRLDPNATHDEEEFYNLISKLSESYLSISPEDMDVLRMIAKKY